MKMVNGNISCKALDGITEVIKVGGKDLEVPTRGKSYKTLEVVSVDPELKDLVKSGDVIYVPLNSGYEVEISKEKYTIVNVREIILIKD